ncbi:MAG: hypothetical protein K2N13_08535, partial [Paraprevotella sp.]|nr:hypothetical protein [Paraprevotella sp.]
MKRPLFIYGRHKPALPPLYAREHATFDMPHTAGDGRGTHKLTHSQSPLKYTRAHAYNIVKDNEAPNGRNAPEAANDFADDTFRFRLPDGYRWPRFMQQMVDCGE